MLPRSGALFCPRHAHTARSPPVAAKGHCHFLGNICPALEPGQCGTNIILKTFRRSRPTYSARPWLCLAWQRPTRSAVRACDTGHGATLPTPCTVPDRAPCGHAHNGEGDNAPHHGGLGSHTGQRLAPNHIARAWYYTVIGDGTPLSRHYASHFYERGGLHLFKTAGCFKVLH